jgi:hypothetical protein
MPCLADISFISSILPPQRWQLICTRHARA